MKKRGATTQLIDSPKKKAKGEMKAVCEELNVNDPPPSMKTSVTIKLKRCNPDGTFPRITKTNPKELNEWGRELLGKEFKFIRPQFLLDRPQRYQPVVGVCYANDHKEILQGIQVVSRKDKHIYDIYMHTL